MEELAIVSGIVSIITLIVFLVMASNLSKLLKESRQQNIYLSKIVQTNEDIVLKKDKVEYYEIAGNVKIKDGYGNIRVVSRESWSKLKDMEGTERVPFNS